MGRVGGYNVGYNECSRTTNFATAPGRLYIAQSKQHTLSTPPTHHRATLSLKPAYMGNVGGYYVGYDECSRTTNFVTAPGRLDTEKSKQYTLLTPPTHHR